LRVLIALNAAEHQGKVVKIAKIKPESAA